MNNQSFVMKNTLNRLQLIEGFDRSTITESDKNILLENIIRSNPIYESAFNTARFISEAELTQDQVSQLFKAVADGAAQGQNVQKAGDTPSSNRTFLGKGTDKVGAAAEKVKGTWNKIKDAIQQSGPVSGFDGLVDKLQNDTIDALGGKGGEIAKGLQKYREFAKKHPIMQGAVYAIFVAAAATATGLTGPAGLAAVAGGLKLADRLLQGDKASSAIWKGFKTGAIAYAGSTLASKLFPGAQAQGADTPQLSPGQVDQDLANQFISSTKTVTVNPGDNLSTIAQANGTSVKAILQANPEITNPNAILAGAKIQVPNIPGSTYADAVGTASDTAAKVASGAYKPYDAALAGTKALVKENKKSNKYFVYKIIESNGVKTKKIYVTEEGRKKLFTILSEGIWDSIKGAFKTGWQNATNKITYDKLDMNWRRNYGDNETAGPVDVEKVKEFLRKMGVTDYLIDKSLQQLKISGVDASPAKTVANKDTSKAVDQYKQQQQTTQNLNNYIKSTAAELNKVTDKKQKIALTKELVNFMADRKDAPEWENALATVKQVLKTSAGDPAFASAAIQKLQAGEKMDLNPIGSQSNKKSTVAGFKDRTASKTAGKAVAEAWKIYYLNKLVEGANLTWKDLGLTILQESNTKLYNIVERKSLTESKQASKTTKLTSDNDVISMWKRINLR